MTTGRGRLTVLTVTAVMAGGLVVAGAPTASAATVPAGNQMFTTAGVADPAPCEPRHSGPDWRWYDDHHGNHYWQHWEYDYSRHQWYWHSYYNDNRYCK